MPNTSQRNSTVLSEQLEALAKTSATGIFKLHLDSSGKLTDLNDTHSWIAVHPKLLGLPEQTEVTIDHLLACYGKDRTSTLESINQWLATGETRLTRSIPIAHTDNESTWLESEWIIVSDAAGKPLYINGKLRDITLERKFQSDMRQLSERISRILLEVPIAIFRLDITTDNPEVLTYANLSGNWMVNASALYGLPEGTIKSPTDSFNYIHPDDQPIVGDKFNKALSDGSLRYEVEYRTLWPDGTLHWLASKAFLERDSNGTITALNGIQYDITERKIQQQRIEFMAGHDVLTDLPNRALYMETLTRAIAAGKRYNRPFALMYIDLDEFKTINDTLGHDAGDHLLVEIAQRFRSTLRASEFIARIGGDEFVVIADGIESVTQATIVAEKLIHIATQPVLLNGQKYSISTSIGISIFPPHGSDETTLMKSADVALYKAKEAGKNGYRFFGDR